MYQINVKLTSHDVTLYNEHHDTICVTYKLNGTIFIKHNIISQIVCVAYPLRVLFSHWSRTRIYEYVR